MTIEEFDSIGWGANMSVEYNGKEREVASVNFEEKLIGLLPLEELEEPDEDDYMPLPFDWVRCENCTLL